MSATEGMHGHTQASSNFQANGAPIPWAEIFSRHEAVLVSHLEMLESVKGQVAPDGEALRTISSMVAKTTQAINQSKVARKQALNRKAPGNTFNTPRSSSSTPHMKARNTATGQSTDTETSGRRKRSRNENGGTPMQYHPPTPEDDTRATKRRRDFIQADARNSSYTSSGSGETEDISAEVQRRLQIKEERRRRRQNAKPEKRKRESLLSTENGPTGEAIHRKKRARRTSSDPKGDEEFPADKETDGGMTRLKRANNGG